MRLSPFLTDTADGGVDRLQLNRLRQRFLDLNTQRYQRTLAALTERQRQFLQVLPLLFHVNHPVLPGFVSRNTPHHLQDYRPEKEVLRLARSMALSFHYQHEPGQRDSDIEAIFVMGSIGTIGQSDSSDLDIWVCYRPGLEAWQLAELKLKCQSLSHWAEKHLRLEVHFFPMDAQRFQRGELSALSSEGSGSTQHFLLLDEFYRTAVWLGGKVPLWWFIPAEQEQHYQDYREQLLGRRFLKPDEVIDFGPIARIPLQEFIGAGVWHLYKGIESPYKSILKLLLLEAYAAQPEQRPLALHFKQAVYDAEPGPDTLDAYVMVYRLIDQYLSQSNQPQRLALVRRCLYFKADLHLTRSSRHDQNSWQRRLLEQLAHEWGWNRQMLQHLDSRPEWKAPEVAAERSLLVNELSSSYRLINGLSKNAAIDSRLSNNELTILGRKLHAAFERKAGKIEWINPGIARDLNEPHLCFVEEPGEDPTTAGWRVYRGTLSERRNANVRQTPIKRARNLLELLLWCHSNTLLAGHTQIDIHSPERSFTSGQKQQLLQVLRQWLPLPRPTAPHEAFTRNAQVTHLLVLLNLGNEQASALQQQGLQRLTTQNDPLNHGALHENLLHSSDIAQLNTWQELSCRHYGETPLADTLLHLLRLTPPGPGNLPPEVSFHSFSHHPGHALSQRLTQLWQDLCTCFYGPGQSGNSRYLLQAGSEYLLIQYLQQQPQVLRFNRYDALLEKLGAPQTVYSPIVIDRNALGEYPLKHLCSALKDASIGVFYTVNAERTRATLTVIDERGSLMTTTMPFHNSQTLLRPLYRFIRTAQERQDRDGDRLTELEARIRMFELIPGKEPRLEPRTQSDDLSSTRFTSVQAIAEPDGLGGISFNIYCNEREFSALEYGNQLFSAVAAHILTLRQQGERYPCHITDLDLSLCRNQFAPQTGLQLSHYLRVKADLEQNLSRALNQL